MPDFATENIFGDFADCEIISAEGDVFKFSKAILFSRLEYFRKMLVNNLLESKNNKITLSHSSETVKLILDYCYEKKLPYFANFEIEEFVDIANCAEEYFIEEFKSALIVELTKERRIEESIENVYVINALCVFDFMKPYIEIIKKQIVSDPRILIHKMNTDRISVAVLRDSLGITFRNIAHAVPELIDCLGAEAVEILAPEDVEYDAGEFIIERALFAVMEKTTNEELRNKLSKKLLEKYKSIVFTNGAVFNNYD